MVPENPPALDSDEIENWIANDEGLYLWAKSERVNVDGDEDAEPEEEPETEVNA